jgi:hypothetical protein
MLEFLKKKPKNHQPGDKICCILQSGTPKPWILCINMEPPPQTVNTEIRNDTTKSCKIHHKHLYHNQ